MEKAISWMIVIFVIASCLSNFSEFSEAKTVEFCHKNSDCKKTPCAGSFILCVNGVCTCEVSRSSQDGAAPVAQDAHLPEDPTSCSSVSDCKGVACITVGWHIGCDDGSCVCKPSNL